MEEKYKQNSCDELIDCVFLQRNEHVQSKEERLYLYRLDFVAKVEESDGSFTTVT